MDSTLAITRPTTALTPTLQIALLGPVHVTSAGQAVTYFRTNKMRALLVYLAMAYPQSVQRSVLTHLLWHGYTEHSARLNLRQSLARLRHALPLPDLLETDHQRVRLAVQASSFTCDVLLFRELVEACQRHEHKSMAHCAVCRPRLRQAAELYKGPFLENFPDVDSAPFRAWCEAQRAYFADLFAEVRAALCAGIAPVGYLPPPLTSLIGRTAELAELADKLHHPIYRCLTLIGPGGIGKTRLALALGAQVQAHFPDGVWLVELVALEQPPLPTLDSTSSPIANEGATSEQVEDQIAIAIGAVLGVTFQGVNRPSAQVAAYLQDKAALLLLDNFEQLSAGSGLLLHLLAAAPRLRLVVTSRQRLPLHAQLVYTVDGLATPRVAESQLLPVTQWLVRYPSVQLFVDRAQNAGFALPLDAPTLAVIGELCRLVGGSPWAIKLAVAMLDRYSPITLLQAIQRDYRVLDGAWLDLPPRQRSAEAVLRSAWRLLTPREAALLARCAVFHGSFTTAAAEAVGDATPADLQALVQKSLLHPTGDDHFTLHELVRQFAAEQLAQDPVAHEAALARHAAYYLALFQRQEAALPATLDT